ncbi:radial spoke head protein 3 homolog B-like [Athene cunicularia]|uniref:radial spoke head protein 3 homolog B-like n=1 Tax=Athene cunicularia TaxID=194338 RepID=UPI000EF74A3E|nr:radial spoke head protein 3 homolog B-like [Athene cunicularia]
MACAVSLWSRLQEQNIPHHCRQTPRHREVHRRALAEQQVQEQLEPKSPEPKDSRAHAGVQTDFCCDEPGNHRIKVEIVCQADMHLEQPPSLLCSLAEEGGAMASKQKEERWLIKRTSLRASFFCTSYSCKSSN